MAVAAKKSFNSRAAKKAIRLTNELVNIMLLIVILLLIVFGCYSLWDSKQVYNEADAARYEIYKPTAENNGLSFNTLQTLNPEVFSWLTVHGTHIDYPVVQGGDNLKYINTDAEGRYSLSGAIFLDAGSSKDFSDFNSIVYGHHMEKQAMFGEIGLFAEQSYFDARRYGMLYYNGQEHGLEFFAFVHTDAYDGEVFRAAVTGQENRRTFLEGITRKALCLRKDVSVSTEDRLVLLSTCSASTTNGRDILVGKISDEIFDDGFKTEKKQKSNNAVIDGIPGIWAEIPLWVKIMIAVLPFLLILLLILLAYNKRRHSRKK